LAMASKLPGKFDDISKTGSSVLGDDYQVKGFKFEAKQKTNFEGAVATVLVESGGAKDACKTPAKLTWKFPKPLGLAGFAVDKLEYDKDGKYKLECSVTKEMHTVDALKIEAKNDLVNHDATSVGLTYSGIKDASIKFETKPLQLDKGGTLECLYGTGSTIFGAKFTGVKIPDVGASIATGDLFASVMTKKELSEFTGHLYYKAPKDVKVVATGTGTLSGINSWAVGGVASVGAGVTAKAKLESGMKLSAGCKKEISKGLTVVAGASYGVTSGDMTYGLKMNVE